MEQGILEKDGIYFLETSDFAKNNLYHMHWGATYVCNAPYEVKRRALDALIIFYILEGSLEFSYRGQDFTAEQGRIVLLSGRHPNHYYALGKVKFHWIHFSGNAAEAYAEHIYRSKGPLFTQTVSALAKPHLLELMKLLKQSSSQEHLQAMHIQSIFTHLAGGSNAGSGHGIMAEAGRYLDLHFSENIQVEELAAMFNLSRYHFSRQFKQATGSSPHQYLLARRLLHAKQLLANSKETVEAIGTLCGFNSTSHFIQTFRNATGITPNQFRKMPF